MFKKPSIFRGLTSAFAFLLIIMILVALVLEDNKVMVDQTLGTRSELIVTEEDEENPTLYTAFTPDEKFLTNGKLDLDKDKQIHKDLSVRIQEEGSVLLKNENNTLPLKGNGTAKPKVTLLGGAANTNNIGSFTTALAEVFDVNPTMTGIYSDKSMSYRSGNPGWALNKTLDYVHKVTEPSVAQIEAINPNFRESFAQYNDAAIILLVRGNGEGADYKPGTAGVDSTTGGNTRTALALYPNEKEIIKLATDNFSKVIVLIKTVSPMELGDLKDDPKIGAVMWVGQPQTYGAYGIANLLSGKANPSGGLYDLYARNSLSTPAMRNFGYYAFENVVDDHDNYSYTFTDPATGKTYTRKDTSSFGTRGTDRGFGNYLIQAEGIYYGYRYYETRYYDTVLNQFGAKTKTDSTGIYEDSKTQWNYSEEVAWSFGFGLSYSTFAMTIKDVTWDKSAHEQIAHLTVEVKNTGSVAGKTPVQVYGQAPYTQYDKTNLVEKSAVQLLTFEKTKLLDPNETQTLTIDVDLQDLASYDYKTAKTYIMENGDYYFAVGNGAHDALNNMLAAQGKTKKDGMDYDGSSAAAYKWTYNTATAANGVDDYTFSYSKAGVKIKNQLEYADWNDYGLGTKVTYLSRQDWVGTFPKTYDNLTLGGKLFEHYGGNYIDVKNASNSDSSEIKFDQETELKFADMKFADFNDYRWEELIDAMSIEELIEFCIRSGRGFAGVESLNFPLGSYAENGPGSPKIGGDAPWSPEEGKASLGSFPGFSVVASTFSRELAYEYGRTLGNDSLLGEKPMLWLPGSNIHRTAYNGRSEQYQSEDPVLTGIITMEEAWGALQKGAIVTAKHFAFNDQEMGRSGVGTFMTEQKAREIELHAFQIAFEMNKYDTDEKDFGMLGVMTAFNKLGGVECTVNEGLLTGILHDEWNFHGYIVSDLKDDLDLMPQAFKAGLGGYDWRTEGDDITPYRSPENFKYDAELLNNMKEVAHQKFWVFANSNFMNYVNTTTHTVWNMTWWRAMYISGIVISSVLFVASAGMLIVSYVFKKKEND